MPVWFISCKKEAVPGVASLIAINTIKGSNPLYINFKNEGQVPYSTGGSLMYGFGIQINSYSGLQRLRLFHYPDTMSKDDPLFDLQLNMPVSSVNTLFLTGTLNAPDTVLIRESIPFIPGSDSSMALRFINLSQGSDAISINLKGHNNGSEVNSIAYKNITEFKKYAVLHSVNEYVFEFRNAITGDSITTYTIPKINGEENSDRNQWRYRSFTLALTGVPGETGARAQAGLLVPHF